MKRPLCVTFYDIGSHDLKMAEVENKAGKAQIFGDLYRFLGSKLRRNISDTNDLLLGCTFWGPG